MSKTQLGGYTWTRLTVIELHQCITVNSIIYGSIPPVTIPPLGIPPGICSFFLLGVLFLTPRHIERDNSPPPGLSIGHKLYSHTKEKQRGFLCTKSRLQYFYFLAKPYHKHTRNTSCRQYLYTKTYVSLQLLLFLLYTVHIGTPTSLGCCFLQVQFVPQARAIHFVLLNKFELICCPNV